MDFTILYTDNPFQKFCQHFDMTHIVSEAFHVITQDQSFVEKTNGQLKYYLNIKEEE